ncbi:hypothetical protein CKO28_03290 [Rhodovibrio sodomensis]|uniref:Uncharacterized protein n=1 Tax=Rhodovibrio sodomensis TaxID=1088 RepID=A0ABS1DAT6_9PROT|nr:hypothetical protein [Rhodovibrio sodomensis]MBK1667069.1 hypothetical protein [Rhodovibrio sodomensis]
MSAVAPIYRLTRPPPIATKALHEAAVRVLMQEGPEAHIALAVEIERHGAAEAARQLAGLSTLCAGPAPALTLAQHCAWPPPDLPPRARRFCQALAADLGRHLC